MYIPSNAVLIQTFLIGCLYGLIGLGVSLLFGVAKVINWAYGNMFIFLMYLSWTFASKLGIDPLLAVPIGVVFSIPIFFIVHKTMEPLVFKENVIGQLVVTLGFSLIFYGLIYVIWGPATKSLMSQYSMSTIKLGETIIQLPYLIIGLAGIIPLVLVHFLVTKTWYGKAMQATAQNKTLTRIFGIRPEMIYYLVVVVVAVAAGLAASLIFTLWGVQPTDGSFYISLAFVVTMIYRPGSIIGALIGGLIVSYAELLVKSLLGNWATGVATYVLFIILLLVRQHGIRKSVGLKGGISE